MFLANIPGAIIVYSTSVGIVRALQWYRASAAVEAVRQELESKEVRRTRLLLEKRYRPATIVATLRRIELTLAADPKAADRLLHQLARYSRLLLRGSTASRSIHSDLRSLRAALVLQRVGTDLVIDRTVAALQGDHEDLTAAIEAAATAFRPSSIEITASSGGAQQLIRIRAAGPRANEFVDALCQTLSTSESTPESATSRIDDTSAEIPIPPPPPPSTPAASHDVDPRESRSLTATLMMMVLGYGITSILWDARTAELSAILPMSRVISFFVWIPAGMLVAWTSARMTQWKLSLAILGAATVSVAAALAVSIVVQLILVLADISSPEPILMLYDSFFILIRNLLIGFALTAMTFAHALARVLLARNREAARLRDDAALAESREIEARFHPHFLFNALTLIASLIDTDPPSAAAVCRRLSGLVEKTVASAGMERWTMRQELDLAADYLAVQSMRFSDRLRIGAWDMSAGCADAIVPRLVLQPLLENAFKHGVACNVGRTSIGLTVRKRRNLVAVTLWNEIETRPSWMRSGRGLSFVRRRIASAGGELTTELTTAGTFIVCASVPLAQSLPSTRASE